MITIKNGFTATQEYKNQLNQLMMDTFGFSFAKWHAKNLWKDDYESYSVIQDGVMIANVSVYKMKLLIDGTLQEYLQIGAVATKPEYRKKGFSRMLMEEIFNSNPSTPAFLFGGDNVLEFYPKFGFVPKTEQQPLLSVALPEETGNMRKLGLEDPLVDQYLLNRNQYSQIWDCLNAYSVHWFHTMFGHADNLYELPEPGVLIVARQENNKLILDNVFSVKPVTFKEILPHLGFPGVDTVVFGFNPDWLKTDYNMMPLKIEDSTLFVKGDFKTDKPYIVPFMLRT